MSRKGGVNPYSAHTKAYRTFARRVHSSFLGWLKLYTCEICGLKNEYRVFNFHHLDPEKKSFTVGDGRFSYEHNVDVLFKELLKCIYVCENCHFNIHAELGDITDDYRIIGRWRHSYLQNLLGGTD